MKQDIEESITIKGVITVLSRKADSNDPWKVDSVTKNLIMTGANLGRDLIIQWLLGLTAYNGGINWGAIGTGSAAVTSTDTELGAETNRTTPSFAQDLGFMQATLQFYFTDAQLVNQTYYEFGSFVAGSNTVGSGQLFNHALFSSSYIKVAGQDTTVQLQITLT